MNIESPYKQPIITIESTRALLSKLEITEKREVSDEIILQKARIARLEKDFVKRKVLSAEQFQIELNRVYYALQDLARQEGVNL